MTSFLSGHRSQIRFATNAIDLLLPPKRLEAKALLQFALAQAGCIQPRFINVGPANWDAVADAANPRT